MNVSQLPSTLILNVGQDPELLRTRSLILRAQGYGVESCSTGKRSIALGQVTLILSFCVTPFPSGKENNSSCLSGIVVVPLLCSSWRRLRQIVRTGSRMPVPEASPRNFSRASATC